MSFTEMQLYMYKLFHASIYFSKPWVNQALKLLLVFSKPRGCFVCLRCLCEVDAWVCGES